MREVSLKQVIVESEFWKSYLDLVKKETIPYQLSVLKDEIDVDVQAERKDEELPSGKSHAIENFKIAAGISRGEHFGWFFQDSDVYKWLESVGLLLQTTEDPQLEAHADDVIAIIEKAQEKDGYLNTYFQLKFPRLKYRQLYFSHELYCAGHLIEAGIAYDKGTGKSKLLDIAKRFVKHIEDHFGYENRKIQGADGHQEIELALVKLCDYTGDDTYLKLAQFFINVRGEDPKFYQKEIESNLKLGLSTDNSRVDLTYLQAFTQPKYQTKAVGHAVRMLYMATGMAKIVNREFDNELYQACLAIWDDITKRKMYITGGVGSTVFGEAFTGSYDLPNDTMYCETCAAIALLNFAYELFQLSPKAEYLDVIDRLIYNGILSGASLNGKQFFYVNPLEVDVDSCHHNPGKGHVKTQRPDWLGCACCPPNFARTVASIGRYVYLEDDGKLFVNLFMASQLSGEDYIVEQKTAFPFESSVDINYQGPEKIIIIHVPYWAKGLVVTCDNGEVIKKNTQQVEVSVRGNSCLKIRFEQPIYSVSCHPEVRSNIGKVAIQRGPFIFCSQALQNPDVKKYRVDRQKLPQATRKIQNDNLGKYIQLHLPCQKIKGWSNEALYLFDSENQFVSSDMTLIPYYLWGNQGETDMQVWFSEIT